MVSRKQRYFDLQNELETLEKTHRLYLADQSVDAENVLEGKEKGLDLNFIASDSPIWDQLHRAACVAAGMRAEDAGVDLNALAGRIIY